MSKPSGLRLRARDRVCCLAVVKLVEPGSEPLGEQSVSKPPGS